MKVFTSIKSLQDTATTEAFLSETGDEASRPLFVWPVDNTHLKFIGAVSMVRFWAEAMLALGSPYADIIEPLADVFDRRGEI